MNFFDVLILGLIEGITEYLPISSTGHLIVANKFMNLESLNNSFDVIIQLGAILAVLVIFRDKLFVGLDIWKKIILSFIPVGVVGFIFANNIKALFSVDVVAVMFIVGGVVFLLTEFYLKKSHTIKITSISEISYKKALIVGLAQVFALIPGTSRSGATIIGGLFTGMDRTTSAQFSFLIAIPVMFAASGYDFLKHYSEFNSDDLYALLLGFVVSFIVAYLVVKLFMKFLEKFTFNIFGWYRIIFGIILLVVF